MHRQQTDKVDVLISGMGPAGLAVAYQAAKAGKTVALVEKRDGGFDRLQRVYIGKVERDYLTKMLLGNPPHKNKLPNEEGYHILQLLSKKHRKALFKKLRSIDRDELENLKDNDVQAAEICEELGIPDQKRKALINLLIENPLTLIRDYQDMKLINFALNPFNEKAAVPQIAIKHIERYLMNRIEDMNAEYKRLRKPEPIQILTHSTIENLNGTDTKTAIVVTKRNNQEQKREIGFQYLIGADGTKHHLADIVNKTLDESQQIKYSPIPKTAHPSNTHLFAHFIVHTPDQDIKLARDFSIIKVASPGNTKQPQLCFISLDEHSLKSSDGKTVKCTITAEYPDSPALNNAKKPDEATIQFIKDVMRSSHALNLPADGQIKIDFIDEEKRASRLSLQTFTTAELQQANKASQIIGRNQLFFLIGDAYRHPDYRRSHGTGDALTQAQVIGEIFANKMRAEDYTRLCVSRYAGIAQYYERMEGKGDFTTTLTSDTDKMMDIIRKK